MAIGLVEDRRLLQLTEEEVRNLLGEPRVDLSWWSYYVGNYRAGEYRLVVRFDEGGKVTGAEVRKFMH